MNEIKPSPDELKDKLFELAETLDLVTEELAEAESAFKKIDKLEKPTLAILEKASGQKTDGAKKRDAYATGRYMDWVFEWDDCQKKFLNLRAKRDGLDSKIKATISVLSYEKVIIGLVK